jgi:ABC-type glycerol-3-phosphate transport system substrate-binding protein
MKRVLLFALSVVLALASMAGCTKGGELPPLTEVPEYEVLNPADFLPAPDYTAAKTTIRVAINRVDLRNTKLKDYKAEFELYCPQFNVEWIVLNDYENNMSTAISNTPANVLLIPSSVKANLDSYFMPLGDLETLARTYRYVENYAIDGKVYGLPTYGNTNGILYNKKVFANAGVDAMSLKTPQHFLSAMAKIKAETPSVIPYYTNFKDGWPLEQWMGCVDGVAADSDYYYNKLPKDKNAFKTGSPINTVYKLLYDLVEGGYTEPTPSATEWEQSKVDFCRGRIGTMTLMSWAVPQFIEAAQKLRDGKFTFDNGSAVEGVAGDNLVNPDDIGYMTFPYTAADGKMYASDVADFFIGIHKSVGNKSAAVQAGSSAFLQYFVLFSNYYDFCGGIPPRKLMKFPALIESFKTMGVEIIPQNPPEPDMNGMLDMVQMEADVTLWNNVTWRPLVEEAVSSNGKSFDTIMNELNAKWVAGISAVFR